MHGDEHHHHHYDELLVTCTVHGCKLGRGADRWCCWPTAWELESRARAESPLGPRGPWKHQKGAVFSCCVMTIFIAYPASLFTLLVYRRICHYCTHPLCLSLSSPPPPLLLLSLPSFQPPSSCFFSQHLLQRRSSQHPVSFVWLAVDSWFALRSLHVIVELHLCISLIVIQRPACIVRTARELHRTLKNFPSLLQLNYFSLTEFACTYHAIRLIGNKISKESDPAT